LKITILGSGTSQGVPVIACECAACQSNDPRDKRLRCSILVSYENTNIVVDAGPDFRQQMLRANVQNIDAVLITHEHNDHIIGLDDVRPFNFRQEKKMRIYATEQVQQDLKSRFKYIFKENPYPGAPRIELQTINKNNDFQIGDLVINPIETLHGELPVLGFRFGDFTYLTDAKTFSKEEFEKIKGTKILVLSALHHKPHHSHLNLTEALEIIDILQPEKAYLTHISHRMGKTVEVEKLLPSNVELAYDGLEIQI